MEDVEEAMSRFSDLFAVGKGAAFVVRKKALAFDGHPDYVNGSVISREHAIEMVLEAAGACLIVSITGKPAERCSRCARRAECPTIPIS